MYIDLYSMYVSYINTIVQFEIQFTVSHTALSAT